jgi:hypothetical protein
LSIAIFFFFASLEFCRTAMIRHTVNNAIYEGARVGTLPGSTVADVERKCNEILSSIGLRNAEIIVSPNPIQHTTSQVTVTVTIPVSQNLFAPSLFFRNARMTNSLTMQCER